MQRYKGTILILVLILSSLLGLSATITFRIIQNSLKNTAGELHSFAIRENTIEQAFKSLAAAKHPIERKLSCEETLSNQGFFEIHRSFCAAYFPANFSLLSRDIIDLGKSDISMLAGFDFNKIFSRKSSCPSIPFDWNGQSPSGMTLHKKSLVSSETCLATNLRPSSMIIIHSNLYTAAPLRLLATNEKELHSTLAVTGFIDVNSTLFLTENALIIAGGDLHIKNLASKPGLNIDVTIVSSSGQIHIEGIDPLINLKAIAREGVSLPTIYQSKSGHLLLPPLLEMLPYSLH
ncbi:MAG: hypothetical protein GYA55_11095 [SAR324 cluster bacterium]|uniref:Uncharacterized protein n=1 Tax=SAR324 cluster bacterium TaxID=2024889 RepID=A0A7X9FT45_9DELT|nr:hypothetical protein [SAR324 cluster bacterium]